MSQNIFEKHSKIILLAINALFIALIIFVLRLEIFQDNPNEAKYSVYDLARYNLQCMGKRHIMLRENKPNSDVIKVPPYDKTQKYHFRTDENGFVKPTKIYENPDLNIFFLGGSTTECEYVDEPYRFPYLVGRMLEEKSGKKINSHNAGKSGNNSIHSINNLLNKIAPLHPDIIVRMEGINDLSTLLYEATYWNRNISRSNLACFTKSQIGFRNFKNEWDQSPYRSMIYDEVHRARIKAQYRKILTLFVAITKAVGATPVLMTQANVISDNPNFVAHEGDDKFNESYRHLYSEFQNITRQVAQENHIMLIDIDKKLPQPQQYLYDSVHLNNEGSKVVAKIIAEELLPLVNKTKPNKK